MPLEELLEELLELLDELELLELLELLDELTTVPPLELLEFPPQAASAAVTPQAVTSLTAFVKLLILNMVISHPVVVDRAFVSDKTCELYADTIAVAQATCIF